MFSSCFPSSDLSTSSDSSLTQGHTTHGAVSSDSIRWEIQVERKNCFWALSYVESSCITPSHFTHRRGYTDDVYLARDIISRSDVVIKLEPIDGDVHSLGDEFDIYRKLKGGTGIPRVHWFGTESGCDAMVVDRLGKSLEDLFVQCHFIFTTKTVMLLAGQLVSEFDF
jgi:hypothetical protein